MLMPKIELNRDMSMICPECQVGQFTVVMDEAAKRVIAIQCEYCGQFKLDIPPPRVLSLNRAGLLADLIRAVERSNRQSGVKLRWYPFGADGDATYTHYVLRAFTHQGGGFITEDEDVRDVYVWCSGFTEQWFTVEEVLDAMENINDAKHGMDKPMATIDYGDSASSSDKG